MEIKCILKEKVSQKTGQSYIVLYIPDIEKTIFLEPAEIKLLNLIYGKEK